MDRGRHQFFNIGSKVAARMAVKFHYLHRKPPISHAFGLTTDGELVGFCTFGVPASHHVRKSVCMSDPSSVLELNRLWVCDSQPRNTESWFVSRCLKQMPSALICSYADTAWKHDGCVYRAMNWRYAGWTDMERKTPRFDYIPLDANGDPTGKHTRDAFRGGTGFIRVRRQPKHRYWIATGDRRQRRELQRKCTWPVMDFDADAVAARPLAAE